MGRILFFVAIGIVVYILVALARIGFSNVRQNVKAKATKKRTSRSKSVVRMGTCPVCGTHFPEDEAVLGGGIRYCSEACREKGRAK